MWKEWGVSWSYKHTYSHKKRELERLDVFEGLARLRD